MNRRKFKIIVCFLSIITFFVACQKKEKAPLIAAEVFFADIGERSFTLSPAGDMVSYISGKDGNEKLLIKKIGSDEVVDVFSSNGHEVERFFWAGPHHLIYTIDTNKNNNCSFIYDAKLSQAIQIDAKPETKINFLDFDKSEGFVLLTMNEANQELFDVYRINLSTGEKEIVERNPGNLTRWITDVNHEVKMGVASNGTDESIYYKKSGNSGFCMVASYDFRNTVMPAGLPEKEGYFYAISNLNRDKMALVEFDCKSGKETKVLFESSNSDISSYYYSEKQKKILYVVNEENRPQVTFFDNEIENIYRTIQSQLKGQYIKLLNSDVAESRFVVKAYTDKNPGCYYLYDKATSQLRKLGEVNPQIASTQMCAMEPVQYKSVDGLMIEGFVTYPLNVERENLPLIVIPHSGVFKRRSYGYAAETQFFANRGYAVLEVNYRGSAGYGKSFFTKGFKTWSTLIQEDISAGVKHLIAKGLVDPERVGVYGHVFGGFSALNQIIYHPELYQCAASYSGLLNLFTYIKDYPPYLRLYESVFRTTVGDPERDIEYMKFSSPVFQSEKINKPLLMAYGGKDPKVNVNEANQFVKELRNRNIQVNYIFYEREGQYFSDSKKRIAFYKEMEKFFAKHLKP